MKRHIIAILMLLSLLTSSDAVYASANFDLADSDIKTAIEADFQHHYADTLDAYKADFNTNGDITFHKAMIGEGIKYYKIANYGGDDPLEFAGYKFPLYLSGKQVCVIDATNESGEWRISNISNHADFDKKLNQIKDRYKGNGQIRLIIDKSYDAQFVYINDSSGKRYLELNTYKEISQKGFLQQIENVQNDSSDNVQRDGFLPVGYGNIFPKEKTQDFSTPGILLAAAVLLLVPRCMMWLKSNKMKSKL